MDPQQITLFVYNIAIVPIVFFSVLYLILTLVSLAVSKKQDRFPKLKEFPFVSVQIPLFNDPIAERCIKHCLEFDYPKNKFEIIIVDDSTNKETQRLMKSFVKKYPKLVKYIHRKDRSGFKPGALANAMKITKGEVIVVFDSDWIPQKDFLKRIVQPFADPKVAIVQARQGFYNRTTNLITRFAAYTLMTYHTIVMPLNDKINAVFFCGTAGAIRRSAFDEVGGWNAESITEDSELSVRLLARGYKNVYLGFETPSEVPDNFESFLKQQIRWCYGNARVFFDNWRLILFSKTLKIRQKLMIMYITLANAAMPFVILMTFFGLAGWFVGDPQLFDVSDVINLVIKFSITAGFLVMGAVTLYKNKILDDYGNFILSVFTVGVIMAATNSIAFIQAALNKKLKWYCTPKSDNKKALS